MIRTLTTASLKNANVVLRVDFNVPLKDGAITDNARIQATLPTLEAIIESGADKIVLISHLGRPKGKITPELSLAPIVKELSSLLQREVAFVQDIEAVKSLSREPDTTQLVLLENIRFDPREEKNDSSLGKELAELGDVYVNDAFGSAHRAHASTYAITEFLPSYAGLLLEKEYENLSMVLEHPKHPYVAVIGGSKVSSKIGILEALSKKCDTIIIGGAMAYTFLYILGYSVGKSLVEKDFLETAQRFLDAAKTENTQVLLPSDHVVGREFSESAEAIAINDINVPDDTLALDIGKATCDTYVKTIASAACIMWNGPMGVFEFQQFSQGTKKIAYAIAENTQAHTVCGGGDTLAAVKLWNLGQSYTHVSTGGGASLEFLEGKKLPAIQVLLAKDNE